MYCRTPGTDAEAAALGDVLFTNDVRSGYGSVVHRTYWLMDHVMHAHDALFVMKVRSQRRKVFCRYKL